MARLVQCEEWERLKISDAADGISGGELNSLECMWRLETGREATGFFDYGKGSIAPKNWVGSIATPTVHLEVLPRGAKCLNGADLLLLNRNIGQMLRSGLSDVSAGFGRIELGVSVSRYERAIEALCDLVQTARRKKILRQYTSFADFGRSCRGRIVFPQQALEDIRRPGGLYTRWVELDEGVPENRFLKGVLSLLRPRCQGGLRRRVDEAMVDLDRVDVVRPPLEEYNRIRFDRLAEDYRQAILLGRGLLDGRIGGLFAGSFQGNTEVLFMPDVFQAFVGRLARHAARATGFSALMQPRGTYLGQWYDGPQVGRACFEIIPDVQVRKPAAPEAAFVVDSKWKEIRVGSRDLGVAEADVYQMVTYLKRLGCQEALLVYPWLNGPDPPGSWPATFLVSSLGARYRILVMCIGLLWQDLASVAERVRAVFQLIAKNGR